LPEGGGGGKKWGARSPMTGKGRKNRPRFVSDKRGRSKLEQYGHRKGGIRKGGKKDSKNRLKIIQKRGGRRGGKREIRLALQESHRESKGGGEKKG